MKIVIAIATLGRAAIVTQTINDLARQTRQPNRVIICAPTPDDVGSAQDSATPIEVILGTRGLTRQRNAILDALLDEDVVLFIDDDFVMATDYLAQLESVFNDNPDTTAVTGTVLADGIGTAGITHDLALSILQSSFSAKGETLTDVNNGYGCNMAFRCDPIQTHQLRFDEALPLYSWLEDVDFSRKVATYGRCVRASGLRGVHLGTKSGRTSGVRLGYSQVMNPVYLTRRTTMRAPHALRLISGNIAANLMKSFWPEPWIDRRGRLRGNLIALGDVLRGRIDPRRILSLDGGTNGRA